jgi:uncharacterized protein YndB with AHSA1/START domain
MPELTEQKFIYTTYIRTTPEKLWTALTSPELTRQYWFGTDVVSDWKVGSTLLYMKGGKTLVLGQILATHSCTLISYTFHEELNEESAHEPPTKVTLEIEPEAGTETVRLIVTHSDFVENSKHFQNISGGWPAVLSSLKTFLETGSCLEFES